LLPYYPDVAVYSSNYGLKIKLSAHLKNNRVYNLKNPKEFLEFTRKNDGFIFIWDLSKSTLCHLQLVFAKLCEQERNIEVLCLCGDEDCGEFMRKIISYANQKPLRLHFSGYNTLLSSIKLASSRLLESRLAEIAENEDRLNYITLKHDNKKLILVENLIKFVEKTGKNVVQVTLSNNERIESTSNLKDIAGQSTPCLFQCHKSFLVNIKYIKTITPNEWNNYDITLDDELTIPLSKGFFPHFTVAKNLLRSSAVHTLR